MTINIQSANLEDPEFIALIEKHASLMLELSPPDSCHFLPIDGLKSDAVTVWEMRDGNALIGSGALQELDATHGEIKSMHTLSERRGEGLGKMMLEHVMSVAKARGYTRLSLETGSTEGFIPARKLYEAYGFTVCGPFGTYSEDPHSYFMTCTL